MFSLHVTLILFRNYLIWCKWLFLQMFLCVEAFQTNGRSDANELVDESNNNKSRQKQQQR